MVRRIPKAFLLGSLALCLTAFGATAPGGQNTPPGYQELAVQEPLSWPKPRVDSFTLDNGVRFFLIERNELPLIQVHVVVRAGEFLVRQDKAGLAEIAGKVMRSGGTLKYPPRKLNVLLADSAARIETSFGFISGSAGLNVLSEDFRDILPVFVDLLSRPAFPENKIALAKQQLKTRIARRNDEQSSIAIRTYKRLIYGRSSIYAREPEYQTVENISRGDVIRFHRRAYQGANLLVGIVGDFEVETIRPFLEQEFSVFPAGELVQMDLPSVKKRDTTSLHVVGKSDVNQSYLLMGHLGGHRQNPDYADLQVMNEVLGGGFSGRLLERIRTQMGLAYTVFGRYGCNFFYPGMFFVGLQTKTSSTADAIRAVKKELERLRQGVGPEEVKQAKERFFNSLVFRYDQGEEILERRLSYAYRGMDADSFQKLVQKIGQVTSEDVVRAAQKYIRPNSLTILAVGEKEKLVQQLEKLGRVKVLPQP